MNLQSFYLIPSSLFILAFTACQSPENVPLFKLVPSDESGIEFVNQLSENDSINVFEFMNLYTGGGVAAGDVNNDGLPDLYFTGNMVSGRLYLNKSTDSKIEFEDITKKAGVETNFWGTGVNMVDVNQDGLMDIYICASGSKKSTNKENRLYINKGIKEGVPSFEEKAEEYGLNDAGYTTQSAFLDYDQDGDLDVFLVVNYSENYGANTVNIPLKITREFDENRSPKLYKNLSREKANNEVTTDKLFMDVSLEAGIKDIGYGLGIAISDVNNDGWPDIYVACDFLTNDLFYINNQDGTFTNKVSEYFTYSSFAGMGVDIADINNDGKTDIAVVDMTPEENSRLKSMRQKPSYFRIMNEISKGYAPQFSQNTLQLNNGHNGSGKISFTEISRLASVHHTDWSWSALLADLDNDGFKDFYVTNGFRRDMQDLDFITYFQHSKDKKEILKKIHSLPGVKVENYVYQNQGNLQFKNKTEEWGLNQISYSNGAIYADLDNDGDLDIVVNNINDKAFLYQNTGSEKTDKNHYIKMAFTGPEFNRNGIGAKVEIKTADNFQYYENFPVRGFQSCVNSSIIAGLGKNKEVSEIEVTWPDGKHQVLANVPADTSIVLNYEKAVSPALNRPVQFSRLFRKSNAVQYQDKETDYVDFSDQITIPFRLSQSGPGISVGDVNNDGLEDFFVGGSLNFPGSIFIQKESGRFSSKEIPAEIEYEDLGSIFFDADQDGDTDLYVVSGSVEHPSGSPEYQDRLYLNDGEGNFAAANNAIPSFPLSGTCVAAADFDKDGDLDLFIGGRSVPGSYPLPVSSKLLINESKEKDNPLFTDETEHLLPALQHIGMVTAALWTDFDNDSWPDLMLAGDGVPVTFFRNEKGKLSSEPIIVPGSTGFLNSIVSADFDLDGDIDYVLGNLGQNSALKASEEEPVNLYAKDIDKNRNLDLLLFHYVKGKNVLFHTRDEMTEQVFLWRGYYPAYKDFASLTFDHFSSGEPLKDAYHIQYNNFNTSYLENRGNGNFELRALPSEAQIAPSHGMLATDFDNDGYPDLLLAGNSNAANQYIGWMNSFKGVLFKGKGDGSFKPLHHQESGFFAGGNVKSVTELVSGDKMKVLVSKTGDSLEVFEYPKKDFITVPLQMNDAYAEITFRNGKKEKREFYYGSGYLSQTSRHLKISDKVQSAIIYDFQGQGREISNPLLSARKVP